MCNAFKLFLMLGAFAWFLWGTTSGGISGSIVLGSFAFLFACGHLCDDVQWGDGFLIMLCGLGDIFCSMTLSQPAGGSGFGPADMSLLLIRRRLAGTAPKRR